MLVSVTKKHFSERKPEDLVFFCDVDLVYDANLVNRIRFFVKKNEVYFPIFFSQYEIVPSGFWRSFSYGMVAFQYSDFLQTGGFDLDKVTVKYIPVSNFLHMLHKVCCIHRSNDWLNQWKIGWGEEDIDLLNKFIAIKTSIHRVNEKGLFHPFHSKNCQTTNTDKSKHDCLQTKYTHKADIFTLYNIYKDAKLQR